MSDQDLRESVVRQFRAAASSYQISQIGPGDARAIADLLEAPRPTLPICPNCEGEHFTCGACGIVLDATAAPQPVVDREALEKAVTGLFVESDAGQHRLSADDASNITDAILALLTGSAK